LYRLRGRDWRSSFGLPCGGHHVWTQGFVSRRSRLSAVLGIRNPTVQHHREREPEAFGNDFQLAEREIAVVQLPISNALFDQFIHERFDFLRRWFLETTRGTFDRIGEANYGAFFCLRFRSAIAEALLRHIRNI